MQFIPKNTITGKPVSCSQFQIIYEHWGQTGQSQWSPRVIWILLFLLPATRAFTHCSLSYTVIPSLSPSFPGIYIWALLIIQMVESTERAFINSASVYAVDNVQHLVSIWNTRVNKIKGLQSSISKGDTADPDCFLAGSALWQMQHNGFKTRFWSHTAWV